MPLLPLDMPAEIHRRVEQPTSSASGDVIVAKGPFVIMAHGLLSIEPNRRDSFWISSPAGSLSATQAEEVLRQWSEARGTAV